MRMNLTYLYNFSPLTKIVNWFSIHSMVNYFLAFRCFNIFQKTNEVFQYNGIFIFTESFW